MVYNKKTNNIKLFTIIILSLLLVISIVLMLRVNDDIDVKASVGITEVQFEEKYELGTRLQVPAANIVVNGKEYASTYVVKFPNGVCNNSKNVTLSQKGKYTVTYSAKVDSRLYKYEKQFSVFESLVSFTYDTDTAVYTSNPYVENDNGLLATISSGNTLKFNKIIDLSKMTKEDDILSFRVIPKKLGALDAQMLWVVLTDVHDSSNSILLRVRQDTGGAVYIAGRSSKQPTPLGINNGLEYFKIEDDIYGLCTRGNFYGKHMEDKDHEVKISFDLSTKTAHCNSEAYGIGKTEIVKFDDTRVFDILWDGFTTGEVYLSMYAEEYISSDITVLFKEVAGMDLSNSLIEDTNPIELMVDLGDYDETNCPNAVVNKPYKLFPVKVLNNEGINKVYQKVYYSYNSSAKIDVQITDGYFIPTREGDYTIEYYAYDLFGNKVSKTINILAKVNAPEISIEVDDVDRQEFGFAGNVIEVSPVINISGGMGKVKTTIKAICKDTGSEYVVNDYKFIPYEVGTYSVIYSGVDYVGITATFSYNLIIGADSKPIFEEDAKLPKYLINKGKYILPNLYAYDYSSGNRTPILCSILVDDVNGLHPIENNTYIVNAKNSNEVKIVYKAVGQSGEKIKEYTIKTIETNASGTAIDLTSYFIKNDMIVDAGISSLNFTSNKNSSVEFIKPLLFDGFSLAFRIDANKNFANKVNFYLTDMDDESKVLKFTLTQSINADNNKLYTNFSINNGYQYSTDVLWGGDSRDYTLSISGSIATFANFSYKITNYENGNAFEGFSSGYAVFNMNYEFESDGEMQVQLKNLNGQPLSSKITTDNIAPKYYTKDTLSQFSNNGKIIIPVIEAIDVLNSYAECQITITTTNGQPATSIDNISLKNVPTNREYELELESGGKYQVVISYKDGAGKIGNYRYMITYEDTIVPEMQISKTQIHAKLGDAIDFPTVTATDNVTESSKLEIYKYLQTPKGILTEIMENSFVASEKGEYIIRFMTFDEAKNIAIIDCKVIVE